jgi:uncharacterized protein YdbL (DUF1318 family)
MNKAYKWLGGVGAAVTGLLVTLSAHAQTAFVVPTSTANTATAYIGSQLADSGTITVIAVAVGIPLLFYVAHQVIGLFPKSRGARRS